MNRKYYCHVCDRVDFMFHSREHFNWEEFATKEEIARAEERQLCWYSFLLTRNKK